MIAVHTVSHVTTEDIDCIAPTRPWRLDAFGRLVKKTKAQLNHAESQASQRSCLSLIISNALAAWTLVAV